MSNDNLLHITANFRDDIYRFKRERPYDNYFKIGREVPASDVNVAYFEMPEISEANINIINLFDEEPHIVKESDVYVPDKNHVLHSWPDQEINYIDTGNFLITNQTITSDNSSGTPLYYKYDLKYLHQPEIENIYDEIRILNEYGERLTINDVDYEIIENIQGPYKQITLLLSEAFILNTYKIKYSPIYNPDISREINLPEDYTEIINPNPLFEEITHEEFQNSYLSLSKSIYSKTLTAGSREGHNFIDNYQVRVPHRAVRDIELLETVKEDTLTINPTEDKNIEARFEYAKTEDEYNVSYTEGRTELFDFRVYASGNIPDKGLMCYILYDHSKGMTETDNGQDNFDTLNDELIDAMEAIEEQVEGEVVFNILYYTTLGAYSDEFISKSYLHYNTFHNIFPDKYLQDKTAEMLVGEDDYFYTDFERIDSSDLYVWEGRDNNLYSREYLINEGRKEDGLWGGVTRGHLINNTNNMYGAFNYALENMTIQQEREVHRHKDAAIITITSTEDNASTEGDVESIETGEAINKAEKNNIICLSLGWSNLENYDNPKIEELNNVATTPEDNVFKDEDINSLIEAGKDRLIEVIEENKGVYLPLYPSGRSYYTKNKDDLPWGTSWVKDFERIVLKDVKYPDERLENINIQLDAKYRFDTGLEKLENNKLQEKIGELMGNVKSLKTDEDKDDDDDYIDGETCVGDIGFLVNNKERYLTDEHYGTVNLPQDIDRNDKISVIARGDCITGVNSRKYFIKKDMHKDDIKIRLVKEGRNQHWYLEIHNGSFVNTTRVEDPFAEGGYRNIRCIYVTNPAYYENEDINIEFFEENRPEFTGNTKIELEKENLFVEEITTDSSTNLIVPSENNLNISTENSIINWNEKDGLIELQEPASSDMFIQYTYKNWWSDYKGFYFFDENNDKHFVPLDLNPRRGHISGKMTAQGIEHLHGNELAGEVVYIYIRPYYIQQQQGDKFIDIPGTKRNNVLFHTIGHQLDSLNYPFFDREEDDFIQLDDIVLLGKVYIQPESDIDDMVYIDTRTRGGGAFPGDLEELKKVFPELNYYWDVTNWNGQAYPENAVIVIEVPNQVKEYLSDDEVKGKVDKHLALGIVPIIRYV